MTDDPTKPEPTKRCPFCGEVVLVNAIKCKHCSSDLASAPRDGGTSAQGAPPPATQPQQGGWGQPGQPPPAVPGGWAAPPPGTPPSPEGGLTWSTMGPVGKTVWVALCLLFGVGGIAGISQYWGGQTAGPTPGFRVEPTLAPNARTTRIETGVVLFETQVDLMVCTNRALHNCVARYGTSLGDLVYPTTDIEPAVSCYSQARDATNACTIDGGSDARCLARHGVLMDDTATPGDPRTGAQGNGNVRIECDEGYKEGTFNHGSR